MFASTPLQAQPHVELSPNSDLFVILNHIFDTYRNLQNHLQHHNADIQTSAISTIHVNDCLGNSFSQKIVSKFFRKKYSFQNFSFLDILTASLLPSTAISITFHFPKKFNTSPIVLKVKFEPPFCKITMSVFAF